MSKSTLTRRALVASTAAMPAAAALGLPIAQAAAEPDPIFAAMKKHVALYEEFNARSRYEDDLEESGHKLPHASADDSRTPEMRDIVTVSVAAREELAATSPTTLAGLLAYLRFVHEQSCEEGVCLFDGDDETLTFFESIGRSARALARAQS
jgi:hypothetical protein